MKKSKLQRKYINQMRGMGDVPWPERRFKYPATFSVVGSAQRTHIGSCKRVVVEMHERKGVLRRKKTTQVQCGGRVFLLRGSLGRRRVYCSDCRARKEQRKLAQRLEQRIRRYGSVAPRERMREERRTVKMLAKFRRSGVR